MYWLWSWINKSEDGRITISQYQQVKHLPIWTMCFMNYSGTGQKEDIQRKESGGFQPSIGTIKVTETGFQHRGTWVNPCWPHTYCSTPQGKHCEESVHWCGILHPEKVQPGNGSSFGTVQTYLEKSGWKVLPLRNATQYSGRKGNLL